MKKLWAVLLAAALCVSLLAGCSSSGTDTGSSATGSTAEESSVEITAEDTGTITIWVAEEVGDFTKEQVDAFLEANPNYAGYTVTVEAVGEGDAASNMLTDVEGGADIYGFAQDQLARLVSAGALAPVTGDYATAVSSENDSGSVTAATLGDTLYAYPVTSDNGYFLYYDKSVISDPSSLETILADCESAGKSFYMEINNGWYQPAFFFGTGCTLTYETDSEGSFTSCECTYDSEEGLAALKALIALTNSSAFVNGSSVSNATNAAAIVDGTWDSSAAKEMFGDNYACAKLPVFTVDGTEYQLSGFGGFKLMGVKPQEDIKKLTVCKDLAAYLTSEEVQLARYNAVGWGPSNKNAQQSDAVKADEALTALAEQLQYTIPQGQYPSDYWTLATSLGDSIIANDYDNSTDEELQQVLKTFSDTCKGYASAQ